MSDLVLTVRNMVAGYGGEPINHDVSIDVGRGRIVAVRCLMHPGGRPEPVPLPAEVVDRLATYRNAADAGGA